jgi:hypothetical protein
MQEVSHVPTHDPTLSTRWVHLETGHRSSFPSLYFLVSNSTKTAIFSQSCPALREFCSRFGQGREARRANEGKLLRPSLALRAFWLDISPGIKAAAA